MAGWSVLNEVKDSVSLRMDFGDNIDCASRECRNKEKVVSNTIDINCDKGGNLSNGLSPFPAANDRLFCNVYVYHTHNQC